MHKVYAHIKCEYDMKHMFLHISISLKYKVDHKRGLPESFFLNKSVVNRNRKRNCSSKKVISKGSFQINLNNTGCMLCQCLC